MPLHPHQVVDSAPLPAADARPVWRRALPLAVISAWLVIVLAGMASVWTYASTPGPAAHTKRQWPAGSAVPRDPSTPTLLVFLHPECSCSTATLAELSILMAQSHGRVKAHVLMYRPADAPAGSERSSLWREAAAIPGVELSTDVAAVEAERFGVYVSGQTLMYDRNGVLVFDGGITFARGHQGLNDGRLSLAALITGKSPHLRRTPVFGCLLRPAPVA